ncbi:uncharacterized protein LOC114268050 isoform X1 [Camellia sinensis]|uniref:uncharacterized protein LOC114268050 isoform X1 n=2 Tax=Camellia sinensis TaxID=4442 RepID=UPI0010367BC7|nr:uncharacterized protein LOC114268050 isoform X1 [Camellia sinensis]
MLYKILIPSTHLQAPIEYTRQALGLVASLTKMVQTSLDLLSLYRIPIPFEIPAPSGTPAGAAVGPSVPLPTTERRGRQAQARSRGGVRGTRGKSGPSEPILGDDDDETSEEAEIASRQSEPSDGGGDNAGSDSAVSEAGEVEEGSGLRSDPASDSGANGDDALESTRSRKRTKRASRS